MATVRATCPGCQQVLRIPVEWGDRPVKCKKCSAIIRVRGTKASASSKEDVASAPTFTPPAYVPPPEPVPVYPPPGYAYPASSYTPAPLAFETPQPVADSFVPSETTQRYRGKKKSKGGVLVLLTLGMLLLVGGAVGGAIYGKPLWDRFTQAQEQARGTPELEPKQTPPTNTLASAGKAYPRRMIVLSVTKYLYANPLSAGNSKNEDMVGIAARRLAFQWKIPQDKYNNQLFVLEDVGKQARPMLKPVITEAFTKFFETSRAQDRVVLYFGGHATMIDGQAYLVPVDGDLADAKTLIAVKDFWDKVTACPATQKVIIFDVCRINEDGDKVRPGSEPMSPELEKALLAAPAGVQVVTTASAGKNALEYRFSPADAPNEGGSLFLSSIVELASKGKVKPPKDATPDDPLPVVAWMDELRTRMKEVAGLSGKPDPAMKLSGETPAVLTSASDGVPAAERFPMPMLAKGMPPEEVATLLGKVGELPPYRGKLTRDDAVEYLFPFSLEVMKNYQPESKDIEAEAKDAAKFPHRKAALDVFDLIKKEWRSSEDGSTELRTQITGADEATKKIIIAEQETPARIESELEAKLASFEKLSAKLADEPSAYWKVNFLYAHAQLKARLAFMSEYNLALGNIRTDNIPKVDEAKGQAGLILVSSEKMKSKKEVRELADEAIELFQTIAKEHPGTPWAVLAKRHSVMGLGLEWKPYVSGNSTAIE